ncbi:hypothetical protein [Pseudomonas sp. UFMG81]|uniref:hypothetical protein n=1 Tax=Pseudomonas sp. UFMG81 TaxID=2745936 RepID=UPI001890AF14|nr:hypothetical protein [Pseudomonas sp. UFMG81]
MKKYALIALLATAGLTQAAYSNAAAHGSNFDVETVPPFAQFDSSVTENIQLSSLAVPSIDCPAGTYITPVGLCQPEFDFD